MQKERSSFSSRIGFVLAAAGSAIGLGNIWRFPYLAAQYGGGSFLIIYLAAAVTFGFALMMAEIGLGRKTRQSAIRAYRSLSKGFTFEGILTAAVPMIIFPYYAIINGWVIKYFAAFLIGQDKAAAEDGFFGAFISKPVEPLIWFLICLVLCTVVILAGVVKGIEKISKILMPVLLVLMIVLSVYICFQPGAGAGIRYYFVPSLEHLSVKTFLAAISQLFYSLSLAMGIMITYGSYMNREDSLEGSVRQIEVFDTLVAVLAGLMIIPSVFAFSGGDATALTAGPSLMFVTLPKAFATMVGGRFIGAAFFLMVTVAALTSSISLMEAVVSIFMDAFHMGRRRATLITAAYSLVLGGLASLGYGPLSDVKILGMQILDFMDFISNSVLMPVVAIVTCIFVGFVIKPEAIIEEAEAEGATFKAKKLFTIVIKWIAPWFMLAVLVSSILQAAGMYKI